MLLPFKWRITLADGETLELPQHEVKRTIDRRGSWEPPQVVFELTVGGIVRRLWPEDIAKIDQVSVSNR